MQTIQGLYRMDTPEARQRTARLSGWLRWVWLRSGRHPGPFAVRRQTHQNGRAATPTQTARPMHIRARSALVAAFALFPVSTAVSQARSYFTPQDALDIVTASVGDLSDDGRWLAVSTTVRRDSYGQDYRRDGDPTYVRGVPVRLVVIDTRSGATQAVFPDKRPVRAPKWSPDGRRLAMLAFNGDVYEPAIWDRATGKVAVSHLPAGKYVAENSDIRWTPDGTSLVFAVHTTDWRNKARATFATMTAGPVFVQSSLDPFLAWDDVRRMANVRSVVAFDPRTNQVRELVPEARVTSYTL